MHRGSADAGEESCTMILKDIWLDVKAVQARDPAARTAMEVLLLYQGVHALIWHRFAHWFYQQEHREKSDKKA